MNHSTRSNQYPRRFPTHPRYKHAATPTRRAGSRRRPWRLARICSHQMHRAQTSQNRSYAGTLVTPRCHTSRAGGDDGFFRRKKAACSRASPFRHGRFDFFVLSASAFMRDERGARPPVDAWPPPRALALRFVPAWVCRKGEAKRRGKSEREAEWRIITRKIMPRIGRG